MADHIQALRAKYEQVMAEEGAAHPGQVYDPVFDWWVPAVMEAGLLRFLGGESIIPSWTVPTADDDQALVRRLAKIMGVKESP